MEMLTRVHARNLVQWAKDKPEVVVLSADLTASTEIDDFRSAYPDRFFSMGIAEQNMLSFAGGMAREGFIPYIHTFGVFIYRRAYDQIAMSVAYPNLPVKMFGFLPGILTPGGATHQAIEDIAVLRALPNMTILEVGDATEVESVLDVVHAVPGPVYVRMLRGDIPRLFPATKPFRFDQARILSEGKDIALFSSGICTEEAMKSCQFLVKNGISVQHLHISTLKPCRDKAIREAILGVRYGVLTIENHTTVGGLGTVVAEIMADLGAGKRLLCLGIPDTFIHGASKNYLMKELGLSALSIVKAAQELTGRHFPAIEEEMPTTAMVVATEKRTKAEDL